MKGILGPRQILTILVLVALNAVVGLLTYGYLVPSKTETEAVVAQTQSETEARRSEVLKLQNEFAQLEKDVTRYKELEARGFFSDQNRVLAKDMMDRMQQMSGLLKAKYIISSGEVVGDPAIAESGYSIINSPIDVEIEALDDMDVYSFLALLKKSFPGSVTVTDIEVSREVDLTQPLLRQIGSGVPFALVKSKVKFNWRTITQGNAPDPNATAGVSQ